MQVISLDGAGKPVRIGVLCVLFVGCDDDNPVNPEPIPGSRVEVMSYGTAHYTLLRYSADGK